MKVLFSFFSFCDTHLGGRCSIFIVIFWHILINVFVSSLSMYLAYALSNLEGAKDADKKQEGMLQPLLIIMGCTLTVTILGKYISSLIFMSINRNIHAKVIKAMVNTRMQFFDENTSGRIINRLSKDIAVVDRIVFNFLEMVDFIIKCLFSVVFIVISSPYTIIIVVFQLIYFYYLRKTIIIITRDCF